MRRLTKLMTLVVVALVASLAMAGAAWAQTVQPSTADADNATITINNASKGITYSVYKLFDATVTGKANGSIAYQGDIPPALADYFTKDATTGEITAKPAAMNGDKLSDAAQAALKTWAEGSTAVASAVSDGSTLQFTGLPYGYYIVTTTQGNQAITVTSTNPSATIVDKNSTTPTVSKKVNGKDSDEANIGDTVTYTATFKTANYIGEGANAKKVQSYTISDTLPDFLSDVSVTGLTIAGTDYKVSGAFPQFANKKIVIPWVDENGNHVYANGAEIVLTYTAKVNSAATVDGTTGNVNEVKLQPNGDKEGNQPYDEHYEDQASVFTYATALQKVDENKAPLAGAEFTIAGLVATENAAGDYTVSKYDPSDNTITPTTLKCDTEGQLVIVGFKSTVTPVITETKAPDGYNKLNESKTMTVVKIGEEVTKTSQTIYYDADGKVTDQQTETSVQKTTYNVDLLKTAISIVNQKGTELPSTGGIGTTILYIIGAVLVIGAGVFLVTKRRMRKEDNVQE